MCCGRGENVHTSPLNSILYRSLPHRRTYFYQTTFDMNLRSRIKNEGLTDKYIHMKWHWLRRFAYPERRTRIRESHKNCLLK